jgi:hypothetical protein
MQTIPKPKATKINVAPSAKNPWQTIAGALEQLGEREAAILVVVQAPPSTTRTEPAVSGHKAAKVSTGLAERHLLARKR